MHVIPFCQVLFSLFLNLIGNDGSLVSLKGERFTSNVALVAGVHKASPLGSEPSFT